MLMRGSSMASGRMHIPIQYVVDDDGQPVAAFYLITNTKVNDVVARSVFCAPFGEAGLEIGKLYRF